MIQKKTFFFISIISLIVSFSGNAQTAKEIVIKAEDNIRGKTSYIEMAIQIVRPSWTRSMSVKAWSKGEQYTLSVITSPAKDAGTVFLKRVKEISNWVPSIERVVKLPPSMMAQSWMGTDFTNDDLVKGASRITDYIHKIAGDSTIVGRKCWK